MNLPLLRRPRRQMLLLLLGPLALLLAVVPTTRASAATSYTTTDLSATVSGSSVTARATLESSTSTVVDSAKICVRSAQGANRDFTGNLNFTITPTGSVWQKTATFAPGTYRYYACVRDDGVWTDFGGPKTFTVGATAASASVSGAAMPVGDLPGWRQTFVEDFNQPLARGSFPGPYASKWTSYSGFPNSSKVGYYDKKIISAQNGVLDIYLRSENGRPLSAAPVPLVNGAWGGQTYGRFSVRMKADPVAGYGASFLLWSDTDTWTDGEIDFPESGLRDVVKGYNHCLTGDPSKNCLWFNTDKRYDSWRTYTIDWRPEKLTFLIDGVPVGWTTTHIPKAKMHWVMQIETPNPTTAAANSGHVLIDWATIYSRV